jgi:hypothetical protein
MKQITLLLFLWGGIQLSAAAQQHLTINYSREEAYLEISDKLEFVGNISGSHHLINFAKNEKPVLFIYDKALELQHKIILPFIIPERADIRMVPFTNYYMLFISSWYSIQYMVWKIDGEGNSTDLSDEFNLLLKQQHLKPRQDFQLLHNEKGLLLWYHTNPENIEQNTLVMLQTDSMLQPVNIRKVVYDFKRDEEQIRQEIMIEGKYLLVVKTTRSSSGLELMKLNLATGLAIKNTFYTSGFVYSQPNVNYDKKDSSITLTAMLSDIGKFTSKFYVFLCRLNSELAEQTPVTIFKKQFAKSTSTNFVLVNHATQWIKFRSNFKSNDNGNLGNIGLYQDYIAPIDSNRLLSNIRPVTTTMERLIDWDDQDPGIRFSLLNKNFTIVNEKRVANTKDAYTIRPEQFCRFTMKGKEFMIVGQRFRRKQNGLLLVSTTAEDKLEYTDIRVVVRRDYVLSKTRVIAPNTIIMPYLRKHMAGLVKISIE